jgi:hypothetical protein
MAGTVIRPFRRDDTEPVVALWRPAGLVVSTNQGVIDWYRSLGYEPDHAVSLGKRLIPDGVGPSAQ